MIWSEVRGRSCRSTVGWSVRLVDCLLRLAVQMLGASTILLLPDTVSDVSKDLRTIGCMALTLFALAALSYSCVR